MLKKILTPVILILVTGLSWWYVKSLEKSLMPKPETTTQGPDYFMFDAVSTVLNQAGKPEQQLATAYLAHYPDDDRTELKDAHLTLHQEDGSLWSIKANKGTLYNATEQIFLSGQVVIERPQPTPATAEGAPQETTPQENGQGATVPANILQGGLKIETDQLRIDAARQFAETNDPVHIISQELKVNALGMKANLQTKTVELLAKVRGTYAPQH